MLEQWIRALMVPPVTLCCLFGRQRGGIDEERAERRRFYAKRDALAQDNLDAVQEIRKAAWSKV